MELHLVPVKLKVNNPVHIMYHCSWGAVVAQWWNTCLQSKSLKGGGFKSRRVLVFFLLLSLSFRRNSNPQEQIPGNVASSIIKPLTVSDLESTLRTCQDSAPGSDGIPYSILGLLWPTFGPLLSDPWNHSLQKGKLHPSHKV